VRNRWITPNNLPPAETYCRRLIIPFDVEYLRIVVGCLDELRFPDSFEQVSGITPQQTADAFLSMFERFNFDGDCMIGQIIAYVSASPPAGTIPCDGATYLRTDYPDLYASIDSFYVVDADHFVTPDLRGRAIVGVGTGSGLTTRNLGDLFGEENHILTTGELASHSHTDIGHTHVEGTAAPSAVLIGVGAPAPTAVPSVGVTGSGNANLSNTGSNQPHNTCQPSNAINYAIVAQ